MADSRDTVVIALGGNAIARQGDEGTIQAQYRRAEEATAGIAELVVSGYRVAITHGNGPVVGDIVLRGELASAQVTPTPLFISGADSEGGIGLMLQQVLGNALRKAGSSVLPATVVTQVVVDPEDPALLNPTKPIGPYFSQESAMRMGKERGWQMAEERGRGWRRVVPSPRPMRIIESPVVKALLESGIVPIAAGGGGVPVMETSDGSLTGVDAVVDKDWSGALLAMDVDATHYIVLMEADGLYQDFGTASARLIQHLTPQEARALVPSLPPGSIGPKVAACAWFAERGGVAIMCSTQMLPDALRGSSGTTISAP